MQLSLQSKIFLSQINTQKYFKLPKNMKAPPIFVTAIYLKQFLIIKKNPTFAA
jgi:hypothetical protein